MLKKITKQILDKQDYLQVEKKPEIMRHLDPGGTTKK